MTVSGMKTVIKLLMPPTDNHLFAGNGKRRYRTKKYDAWLKEAGWQIATQRHSQHALGVSVLIEVSDHESNNSWDLTNRQKAAMDLLVKHQIIQNDSKPYVREFHMRWADIDGIRVTVEQV